MLHVEFVTCILKASFSFSDGGTMPLLLTRDMEDTYMQSTLAPKVQGQFLFENFNNRFFFKALKV